MAAFYVCGSSARKISVSHVSWLRQQKCPFRVFCECLAVIVVNYILSWLSTIDNYLISLGNPIKCQPTEQVFESAIFCYSIVDLN
jgi:hypothetical protein